MAKKEIRETIVRPCVMLLKCPLTDGEILEKSSELVARTDRAMQLEQECKQIQQDFKARIQKEEAEAALLSSAIREKAEHRNVKCEWHLNYPEIGEKTLLRLDTLENVRTEVMSDHDRQYLLEDVSLGKDKCDR